MVDRIARLVGEGKELGIGLEAVCHRKLVGELIVAIDRFTGGYLAGYGCGDTRLGDVVTNAVFFPIGIARAQTPLTQQLLLRGSNFVVGNGNALSVSSILSVKTYHGMRSCP